MVFKRFKIVIEVFQGITSMYNVKFIMQNDIAGKKLIIKQV